MSETSIRIGYNENVVKIHVNGDLYVPVAYYANIGIRVIRLDAWLNEDFGARNASFFVDGVIQLDMDELTDEEKAMIVQFKLMK